MYSAGVSLEAYYTSSSPGVSNVFIVRGACFRLYYDRILSRNSTARCTFREGNLGNEKTRQKNGT